MKTPEPLDRRRSTRILESLPFQIGHQDYEIQAQSINISAHGAMCRVDKDIPLMTELKIAFQLPTGEVRLTGVVVRKHADHPSGHFLIAIFFSKISSANQKKVDAYIQNRALRHP